ncbi:hypothetical protein GJ496_006267 [Pomphorhynchus laevis]|nr:hypothetical protein GJ496_006267 [Pomphorhynchus laevis]
MTPCDVVRVAILGNQGVGKTSIIHQALYTEFTDNSFPTRIASYYNVTLFSRERLFNVMLIDTPSFQETDESHQHLDHLDWVKEHCYRRCSLFVLVYDVSNDETFTHVKILHNEIAKCLDNNEFPVIILGNKVDLLGSTVKRRNDKIDSNHFALYFKQDIANFARKVMKVKYLECSAKYNWNITKALNEMATMLQAYEEYGIRTMALKNQAHFPKKPCTIS